jgi:hypothetical protein
VTGDVGERRHIQGILLYFPKTGEGETNPNLQKEGLPDDNTSYLESSRNRVVSDYPVFNVYWQNRLVPETAVWNLPFFPKRSSTTSNIPQDWKDRVKGYLFLDGTFKHISNNKLKITVYPNLDTWINDKETFNNTFFKPKKNIINETFSRLLVFIIIHVSFILINDLYLTK